MKISHLDEKECIVACKLQPPAPKNEVRLLSNIFRITPSDFSKAFRYDVAIQVKYNKMRPIDLTAFGKNDSEVYYRRKRCQTIMRTLFAMNPMLSDRGIWIYDLSKTLFVSEALKADFVGDERPISYDQMPGDLKLLMGNCDVRVKIGKPEGSGHAFCLNDFAKAVCNDLSLRDDSLRAFYDILTNNAALQSQNYFSFGRGRLFFEEGALKPKSKEMMLPDGCHLVNGIAKGAFFAFDDARNETFPALSIDSRKGVFYDSMPLLQFLLDCLNMINVPQLRKREDFTFFAQKVRSKIKNVELVRKNYRGSFVATNVSRESVQYLSADNGMPLRKMYEEIGVQINPDLPAIEVRKGAKKSYFPLEMLLIAPYQRIPLESQSNELRRLAIKQCAVTPSQRFMEIRRHLEALNLQCSESNTYLSGFGVSLSKTPLPVAGHVRDAPDIKYFESSLVKVNPESASWIMKSEKYLHSAELIDWFVFYDKRDDSEAVRSFVTKLMEIGMRKGIKFEQPVIDQVPFQSLDKAFADVKRKTRQGRPFIMYIDSLAFSHENLKYFEATHRITTQHVRSNTVRDAIGKEGSQKLENIVNKLNCKNFGQCYGIEPENSNEWLSSGKTLVIGYDISHPPSGSKFERRLKGAPSVPSVLGISYNASFCPETFVGDFAYQQPKQEEATSSILSEYSERIVEMFYQNRGSLPEFLIVARDGVSIGQFKMVLNNEIPALKKGISEFSEKKLNVRNYSPKILCVIVRKRHSKRFVLPAGFFCLIVLRQIMILQNFVHINVTGGVVKNCLPSTVVDRNVTRCDMTEFFLQAHRVGQGTGKMPSYTIPLNEMNWTMDEIESFMLSLCYNHQIINQAVSIPEPIFQAHEWAKRGKNNFNAFLRLGDVPFCEKDGKNVIDWNRVTRRLRYMRTELEMCRTNA